MHIENISNLRNENTIDMLLFRYIILLNQNNVSAPPPSYANMYIINDVNIHDKFVVLEHFG